MRFYAFILSVHPLLIVVLISYFSLLYVTPMPIEGMTADLLLLGMLTAGLSLVVLSRNFPSVTVSVSTANRLLGCSTVLLLTVTPYLAIMTEGEISQLLDARFQLPGFGMLSSLFLVATMIGSCVVWRSNRYWLKAVFAITATYVGYIVGGKGFFGPVLFGISIGLSLRIYRVSAARFIFMSLLLLLTLVIGFFQKADSLNEALELGTTRVVLAADSVQWVGDMSASDVRSFSISPWSFVADIPLRFIGIRLNPRSVGSEIAYVVASDESGGGPNANLPTMAYLLNQGEMLGAVLFICATFLLAFVLLSWARSRVRHAGGNALLYFAVVLLAPTVVIDMLVFLQYLFWLALIGALSSVWSRRRAVICITQRRVRHSNGRSLTQPNA